MIIDFSPVPIFYKFYKVKQLLPVKYIHSEVINDKQVQSNHLAQEPGSLACFFEGFGIYGPLEMEQPVTGFYKKMSPSFTRR